MILAVMAYNVRSYIRCALLVVTVDNWDLQKVVADIGGTSDSRLCLGCSPTIAFGIFVGLLELLQGFEDSSAIYYVNLVDPLL